jgi:DNA-binding winged helix-turn-helix (wHTH) protein/Tol biopolymer transport system component
MNPPVCFRSTSFRVATAILQKLGREKVQETAKSARVFRFGVFEVDAATGEVRKQGMRIRLQEQPSQLLLMLLERAGEVVGREEICRKLWPPETFVDFDQSLGTALRKLRQALNDDAETPHYIETIPKHGLRFVAPVERIFAANSAPALETKQEPHMALRVPIFWWAAFAATCALSLSLGWMMYTRRAAGDGQQSRRPTRSSILPPSGWYFEHSSFSVSPDGTRLAFVAFGPEGNDKLWVRALSASNARQINGTEGALLPFWSPDSRRIAFFAAGKLAIVDLDSGAVRAICEAPFGRSGGTWGRDGTIVFSPFVDGPLYRVQDSGGAAVPVTRIAESGQGRRHMWPSFLPDGTHFLYSESRAPNDPQGESIYVGSLDGSSPKLIASMTSGNSEYAAGYLVYGQDHILWAQPFDLRRLEFRDSPTSLTSQELDQEVSFSHAEFSVSANGVLVFQSLSDSSARLAWFDSTGNELGQIGGTGYRDPRLSPNGRLLALSSDDERNGKSVIRVLDFTRGISTRVTDGGNEGSSAWSPDSKRITYRTIDSLTEVPVDGSGPAQILLKGEAYLGHMDWSVDGHLVFTVFSGGSPTLKIYSTPDRQVVPFAIGAEARFSPDGKWIAYVGPLSAPGSDAIFIAPFHGPGVPIRVSSGSGAQPTWEHDGKRLFYVAPDRKLMMVEFDPRGKTAAAPRVLFQSRIIAPNFSDTQYAVSRDDHFLINSFSANNSSPLTLITGWKAPVEKPK